MRERIYRSLKEVEMLFNAIRREREQFYQAGKKEGKREGKSERSLEIARRMLSFGEPLEKIKQYTGLSGRALRELRGVAKASDRKNSRQRSRGNHPHSN